MTQTPGWLVGNLDAEAELARAAAPRGREPRGLPEALQRQLAAAALLMRALAREGDRLLTARPVAPGRLAEGIDLPLPELVTGSLPDLGPCLPWCPTPSIAASGSDGSDRIDAGAALHERLWCVPRATAATVARVAHRAFCLDVARAADLARPGVRSVHSWDELAAHLAGGGAESSSAAAWVLKPPYSAAGRGHVPGRGELLDDDGALRRRIERLIASAGELLFEPWLERVDDWGVCALVTHDAVELVGIHRLLVDERGRFSGIDVVPPGGPLPELSADDVRSLENTALMVGRRLAAEGFAGPFGVDAWRHRERSGRVVLEPLGEINPRLTFGFVARALSERLGPALGDLSERRVGLRFAREADSRPSGALTLLHPGDDDRLCAWLERVPVPAPGPQVSS